MIRLPYRFHGQTFVGLATRRHDKTLDHYAYAALPSIPNNGQTILRETIEECRKVIEVLTDDALLKERSSAWHVPIKAVAVVVRNDA